MISATVVGRPNFDLPVFRQLANVLLGLDLTTNTKGPSEALAVCNALICGDEYKSSIASRSLLDYSVACVVPFDTLERHRNFFYNLRTYTIETIKPDYNLVIIQGTLESFVSMIKMLSTDAASDETLKFCNAIQTAFENDALSRVFSDTVKEKRGSLFYLKRK